MPNAFMPSDPDLVIGSGTMGRSTWVAGGTTARFSIPGVPHNLPPADAHEKPDQEVC